MLDYGIKQEVIALKDGPVLSDYSEYTGLSIDEIMDRMDKFQKLNSIDYVSRCNKDDKTFYESSDTYIYDLLGANPDKGGVINKISKFIPNFFNVIKEHPGKEFMEFGGGIGLFCEIIKEWTGKNVTYVDLNSKISEFASWRYDKYNIDVDMLSISQHTFHFDKTFDLVFSDAVWEHLTPQVQIDYLRKLDMYVNDNGLVTLIIDLSGENPKMPMHYNVDIVKICSTMKSMGYTNIFGDNQFASVWHKGIN